jgi:hypothetical protein
MFDAEFSLATVSALRLLAGIRQSSIPFLLSMPHVFRARQLNREGQIETQVEQVLDNL